jgi:hypothetical protein
MTPITTLSDMTSTLPVPALVILDLKDGLRLIAVLAESEPRKWLFVALHSIRQILFHQKQK